MKVSDLQELFISELKKLLPEWKFVKKRRHFKIKHDEVMIYFS